MGSRLSERPRDIAEIGRGATLAGQYIAKVRNLMSLPRTVGSCYIIVHNNYDVIN